MLFIQANISSFWIRNCLVISSWRLLIYSLISISCSINFWPTISSINFLCLGVTSNTSSRIGIKSASSKTLFCFWLFRNFNSASRASFRWNFSILYFWLLQTFICYFVLCFSLDFIIWFYLLLFFLLLFILFMRIWSFKFNISKIYNNILFLIQWKWNDRKNELSS